MLLGPQMLWVYCAVETCCSISVSLVNSYFNKLLARDTTVSLRNTLPLTVLPYRLDALKVVHASIRACIAI